MCSAGSPNPVRRSSAGGLRRRAPIVPVGTVVRLPSGRCVEVQGARQGKGVREIELRCVYTHPRLGHALRPGRERQQLLWLTQRFVMTFGEVIE